MVTVGIIAEYNPFHNGHLHHINKIKEMFEECTIVLAMSGNFTQRGEPSIINKWDKTKIALLNGVDVVIEIPFVLCVQSADYFAKASVEILNHMKCDYLVFGSESEDLDKLTMLATLNNQKEEFSSCIKKYLKKGINYPTAVSSAMHELTGASLDTPNDILGLCYIREIARLRSNIKPVVIKRTNDYHSTVIDGEIASATSIREALIAKIDVKNTVPSTTYEYLNGNLAFSSNYFNLIKYKIISEINYLDRYDGVDQPLAPRIKDIILNTTSYEDMIMKVKSKGYTYNKVSRMFAHILVGLTKEEYSRFNTIEYLRLLGFTKKGQEYLSIIKKDLEIPLVTNYSSLDNDMLKYDFKATCVYAQGFNLDKQKKIIEAEYKNSPIII